MSQEGFIAAIPSLTALTVTQPLAQVNRQRHQRQQQIWHRVNTNLKTMRLDLSPFVPKSFDGYVTHIKLLKDSGLLEEMYPRSKEKLSPIAIDMACVRHCGLESMVDPERLRQRQLQISNLTVFSQMWKPTEAHPEAPWPTIKEFQEEGDERFTSQYGRFLPIPRVPAFPGMNWKNMSYLEPHDWDRVYPVPKNYFGLQLPNDHDIPEPEVDDDAVYVDNCMSSGRVVYVGEPMPGEAAASARDMEWESQYFRRPRHLNNYGAGRGTRVPTSRTRPDVQGFNNVTATSVANRDAMTSTRDLGQAGNRTEAMLADFLGQSPSMLRAMPSSSQTTGRSSGTGTTPSASPSKGFSNKCNAAQVSPRQKQITSSSQATPRQNPIDSLSGTSWRRVSYGRNSFSKKETIKEESSESASDASFHPNRGEIVSQSSPRARMSFGPIARPDKQDEQPNAGDVTPKTPEVAPEPKVFYTPLTDLEGFQLGN